VRLGIFFIHGSKRGPAHLAAYHAPRHSRNSQIVYEYRWRADAFAQVNRIPVVPLDSGSRGVVAAVFQRTQQDGRHFPQVGRVFSQISPTTPHMISSS
jgi:hypothetical protein